MQFSLPGIAPRRADSRSLWRALFERSRQAEAAAPAPRVPAPRAPALGAGTTASADSLAARAPGAFERFFRAHEPEVTGYLWRMTGDVHTARDLSQETFVRAWQHFDRVGAYDRPGAWLIHVATNLALQHLRRRGAPVGAAMPLDEAVHPAASDPGRRIVERDLVRETLLELSPRWRAVLVLREVHGLSGPEVAEALDMSPETVRVTLWRARAQFRAFYEQKGGRI